MECKAVISKSVLRDYDDAMRYIATEYGSPRVMKNLASEYDADVAALVINPLAYPIGWGVSPPKSRMRYARLGLKTISCVTRSTKSRAWVRSTRFSMNARTLPGVSLLISRLSSRSPDGMRLKAKGTVQSDWVSLQGDPSRAGG